MAGSTDRIGELQLQHATQCLRKAQGWLAWADHVVILPVWLGSMSPLFKTFFEQVFRPELAFAVGDSPLFPRKKLLARKSARITMTMGMPFWFYRGYFRARHMAREDPAAGRTGTPVSWPIAQAVPP